MPQPAPSFWERPAANLRAAFESEPPAAYQKYVETMYPQPWEKEAYRRLVIGGPTAQMNYILGNKSAGGRSKR
jgi:hypothetical protein